MTNEEQDYKALRGAILCKYAAVATLPDGEVVLRGQYSSLESARRLMSQGDRLYHLGVGGSWWPVSRFKAKATA